MLVQTWLQSEHFKYADTKLCCVLRIIFNAMFSHGYLPSKLMETIIIPIIKDKKGLVTDKDNYRPVAVTSVVSKIIELILLIRLQNQLETVCNQFGFKTKHGTDMCVFSLKQIIEYYNSRSSPVYVCYLDASKAFDRINHWCLFNKLIKRGIDPMLIRFLVFWYSNQTFCVRWGNIYSPFFTVSNGVRQGGIMSPVLFNIYMDDLSNSLNNSKLGCSMNGVLINHLMYADDTCIIAPSPSALYKLLGICTNFAQSNFVKFNESKTKCMCFKPKNQSCLYVPDISLNNKVLSFVPSYRYLGVIVNNKLDDDDDIMRHVKSLYARGNMLISRFRKCSDEVKTKLFKSFFSNAYCSQLWCVYRQSVYKKSYVAYNNIYRKLFDVKRRVSISAIYVNNNIDSSAVLIRKSVYSLKTRLCDSHNTLISCIMSSLFHRANSRVNLKWTQLLYT